MKRRILILCAMTLFLAGCTTSEKPQSAEKYQGREETKKLEAATAAGYDGAAVRKTVDTTLNSNDQHNQELDKALKTGNQGEQKP